MSITDEELTPPDLDRCQTEWRGGSFMTLGPRPWVRCDKPPTCVAFEKKAGADGRRGSMSLCDEHRASLEKQQPGHCTFKAIVTEKKVKR